MDNILEYMRKRLGCPYISDLREEYLLKYIILELANKEDQFTIKEIMYLLTYVNSKAK